MISQTPIEIYMLAGILFIIIAYIYLYNYFILAYCYLSLRYTRWKFNRAINKCKGVLNMMVDSAAKYPEVAKRLEAAIIVSEYGLEITDGEETPDNLLTPEQLTAKKDTNSKGFKVKLFQENI